MLNSEEMQKLEAELASFIPKGKLILHERIDSTNDEAKRLVKKRSIEEIAGTVIISKEQHKGRGTQGKAWFSPPGMSLYTSIVFKPSWELERSKLEQLPLTIANSFKSVLLQFSSENIEVKPPNDILVNGKKLVGILCETATCGAELKYLIVGVGINLSEPSEIIPSDIQGKITFLEDCIDRRVDLLTVYKELISAVYSFSFNSADK